MMTPLTAFLLLLSVLLSTAAQLMLKVGMTPARLPPGETLGIADTVLRAAMSPWVIAGLGAYFASALTWLLVLSKVDVSRAYPCVALGFALTVAAGHYLLDEPVSAARIVGVLVISIGVVIVATS
jgi:multidrug transporter EmrE-like cation transporter